jgi:hypothetical protein
MGYKLLGFAVWKGARWYVRRRVNMRKVVVVGGVLALGAGGLVVALRSGDHDA